MQAQVIVYPIDVIHDRLAQISLPQGQQQKLLRLVNQCSDSVTESMYYRMEALRVCFFAQAQVTHRGNLTFAHLEQFVCDLLDDPDEDQSLKALKHLFKKMDEGFSLEDLNHLFLTYNYARKHQTKEKSDFCFLEDKYVGCESVSSLLKNSVVPGIVARRLTCLDRAKGKRGQLIRVPDQVDDVLVQRGYEGPSLEALKIFLGQERSLPHILIEEIALAILGTHYTGFLDDRGLAMRLAAVFRDVMAVSQEDLVKNRRAFLRHTHEIWKEKTDGPLNLEIEIFPFIFHPEFLPRNSLIAFSLSDVAKQVRFQVCEDEKFDQEKKKYQQLTGECKLSFYDHVTRTVFLRDYPKNMKVESGPDALIERVEAIWHELEHARHLGQSRYWNTRFGRLCSEGQSKAVEGLVRYCAHSDADFEIARRLGLSVGGLWCLDW